MLTIARLVVGFVGTNCYIVCNDETKECVIVDPGDNAAGIQAKIKDMEMRPQAVLLTHGHFDHIMAVPGLRTAFPDIPVYACRAEEVLLSDAKMNESRMINRPLTIEDVHYLEDGADLVLLGETWKLIATPGHTIGSCCYYIESEKWLFSGDTLFCGSIGRSDLPTGSGEQIMDSVHMLVDTFDADVKVYPGHGDATTIGEEKEYNPFCA